MKAKTFVQTLLPSGAVVCSCNSQGGAAGGTYCQQVGGQKPMCR